jgi:serine/threonine protein phosphatase PrpC
MGECVADYDPMEGILLANTGSKDLVAGTTASMVAMRGREITFLNCGDSRSLLVNEDGIVIFVTEDHTPEREMGRLHRGRKQGLDYSIPECSLSRWWIQVGDYQYAVCRSLEGPFATSKGIVSDPDVTSIRTRPGVLVMASDGLFGVLDNEQVGKEVARLKRAGTAAGDVAKRLCSMAIDKGSTDNVSAVVVYLASIATT